MGLAERYGPLSTRCALRVARAWAVLAVGLCMCGIGCTPLAVDAAASAAPLAARTLTVDVAKTTAPPPRRASHNWDAHVPRYFVAGAIAMEELNPLFTNSPAPPYMFQGRAYPQFRHLQAAGFGFCAQDYQQRSQRPCPNFA
ncbi:MAG TPA: hypothetical protein VFN61_03915, partial [Acidimicrobiales bacterium]|nr:hypothetical protein [Acidimicrobiales bacterium]